MALAQHATIQCRCFAGLLAPSSGFWEVSPFPQWTRERSPPSSMAGGAEVVSSCSILPFCNLNKVETKRTKAGTAVLIWNSPPAPQTQKRRHLSTPAGIQMVPYTHPVTRRILRSHEVGRHWCVLPQKPTHPPALVILTLLLNFKPPFGESFPHLESQLTRYV